MLISFFKQFITKIKYIKILWPEKNVIMLMFHILFNKELTHFIVINPLKRLK